MSDTFRMLAERTASAVGSYWSSHRFDQEHFRWLTFDPQAKAADAAGIRVLASGGKVFWCGVQLVA